VKLKSNIPPRSAQPPHDATRTYWRSCVIGNVQRDLGYHRGADGMQRFLQLVSGTHDLRESMQVLVDDMVTREQQGMQRFRLDPVCAQRCTEIARAFRSLAGKDAPLWLQQVPASQRQAEAF